MAVALSPGGNMLASALIERTVRVWNATTGQEGQKLDHPGYFRLLTYTLDNITLLSDCGRTCIDIAGSLGNVPRSNYSCGIVLDQSTIGLA